VQIKHKTGLMLGLQDLFLDVIDRRGDNFGRLLPYPIGVDASEFRPGIAMDNSVRVDHGHNLEDIVVIERTGVLCCLGDEFQEIVDDAFDHEAGGGLDGVLSGQDPDDLAVFDGLLAGGNGDQVDGVFAHCLAELLDAEDVCVVLVREQAVHVVEQLGVGVGIGRREVDCVESLPELVLKG